MNKLTGFIVKKRYLFLGLFLLLFLLSFFGMKYTNINYDLSAYLSKDTETKQALEIMEEEFQSTSSARIMVQDESQETIVTIVEQLQTIDGIALVQYDASTDYKVDNSHTYALIQVTLDSKDYDIQSQQTVLKIQDILQEYQISMSGVSVNSLNMEKNINREITIILLVSCIIIFAVLLLTSHSWFEPVIFLVVIGISILINMGTNLIFGSISYITQAVQAILQLALAMDYSIILLHAYEEERNKQPSEKEAVIQALKQSMLSIFSSALTTIAGLAALMFMSFTIGFDIGMVLSKGIICSMLTVFFVMPGLILIFRKPLLKLKHKPLPLKGKWIVQVVNKGKYVISSVLIIIIVVAFVLQSKNDYFFAYQTNDSASEEIVKQFGESNQMVLLIPLAETKEDYQKQVALKEELLRLQIENQPIFNSITTMGEIDDLIQERDYQTIASMIQIPADDLLLLYSYVDLNPDGEMTYKIVNQLYDFLTLIQEQNLSENEIIEVLKLENTLVNRSFIRSVLNNMQKSEVTLWEFFNYINDHEQLKLFLTENQRMLIEKIIDFYQNQSELIASFQELGKTIQTAVSAFNGTKHSRMIFDLSISADQKERNKEAIQMIKEKANAYYPSQNYLAGQNMVSYDIENAFQSDLLKVNLITIFAILLILFFTFKSFLLPFILVFVIQGATYITMAISYLSHSSIFFMSYLICLCIQMGATIDYGIILTSKYIRSRKEKDKITSMHEAIQSALPTILTSGTILVVAGFVVGLISSEVAISSIGTLLGRGTIISILMVLFLLPSLLLLCDRLIMKSFFTKKLKKDCNLKKENL